MKSTGIVRKVDNLGRIVIPRELRRVLNIEECDPVEIFMENETIVLRKYEPGCNCCGAVDNNLIKVGQVSLCKQCISNFKSEV